MSADDLAERARQSGVALDWTDQRGERRAVGADTLAVILDALGAPPDEDAPALVTATVGMPVSLPGWVGGEVEVEDEAGRASRLEATPAEGGLALPAFAEPGYLRLHAGGRSLTLAVAPVRCPTIRDLLGGRGWALAAQIYALRSVLDGGIGNFGGVAALAEAGAAEGADALAVSPVHALFGAAAGHVSPYSPSSRLFLNPLHADPLLVLPEAMVREAIAGAGIGEAMAQLEALPAVDWLAATPVRRRLISALYGLVARSGAADYLKWRAAASRDLLDHAVFETLQGRMLREDPQAWHWRSWAPALQDARSSAIARFAAAEGEAVEIEIFAQWLAERSRAEAQRRAVAAGMRIGLVADLAIGVESAGSQAWSRPDEMMTGLTIGAPPDYYSATGQNWGLTTFSPVGLRRSGYAGFIAMLRANLAAAGGLRIDHVMGFERLWMIPEGAGAEEGAYVGMPSLDLFRLVALEAHRHRATIIGEDLGTLPHGFRDVLRERGVAGMRVLRFERDEHAYMPPHVWDVDAVAMTSTHDMIATAGWWRGADLDPADSDGHGARAWDRGLLWASLERAGRASGQRPQPHEAETVVDAAIGYVADAPSALAVVAVEDMLALDVQPNVPGTTVEKPNWRHRLDGPAGDLLAGEGPRRRAALLSRRRRQP